MVDAKNRIGKQKNTLELAQKLSQKTKFTTEECKSLLTMYQRIVMFAKLDRLRFREILHTTFDITDDIDKIEWVEGLAILLRGTPEQLIDFCYTTYDINGDNSLAREELHYCLKGSLYPLAGILSSDELDEAVRDLVEIAMRKLDVDKDGQITETDFANAAHIDPMLVQAIGPCLPPARSMVAFMATFTEQYRSYSPEYTESWKSVDKKLKISKRASNVGCTTTTHIESA